MVACISQLRLVLDIPVLLNKREICLRQVLNLRRSFGIGSHVTARAQLTSHRGTKYIHEERIMLIPLIFNLTN